MRYLLCLFVLGPINVLLAEHDVPLAIFHISYAEETILIDITFDLEDYSNSLKIKEEVYKLESIQKYINKNTSFQFNDRILQLQIYEFNVVKDHLKLKGKFVGSEEKIVRIKIENTCLVDVYNHSNIIQLDLNNQSRGFRMHKKRTEIYLEY